ncbi:Haloacid dehalogenase-like hydrolase domain-containing protein [Heracleum sosnowskyi]|uniref:Haloacid dehalogenase-like hydrolase domain-containing protein n=1 Tax=Heracleum sosnowskyi TaxID=360622 RepID=A0AAD8MCS9_9APIA|nr:Haloacid dehalogenase-like hydrolase domain-containing protein [Heracleum sosnowskyi]
METTSSPTLSAPRFSSFITTKTNLYGIPTKTLDFLSPFSKYFYPKLKFHNKNLQINRFCASSSSSEQSPSHQLAVLLEVDGVLMDIYGGGNREAFNLAFRKLGLDCANWTKPIYNDLIRKSAGEEKMMLFLYFNRIGWPSSLPTNERETFMKNVLREKKIALENLVMSKSIPLRPGAEDFINDANKEGIPVVILTAYSKIGDKIARSIIEKLGNEVASRVKIVGTVEAEKSFYGQLVLGEGVFSSLDEQLVREARKAASAEKQRIAKEVASMLKLSVDIDTSSSESSQKIVTALRAAAEYVEVPVSNCVLIAGSQSGVAGAERIGMPCIVLRSSSTNRAEFTSANATLDGFGAADLTIAKLLNKRWL